jgi:hypothetical protein
MSMGVIVVVMSITVVMIVIAMLIVVMVVITFMMSMIVVVVVTMMMTVIMRRMVMAVRVIFGMRMRCRIGTAFGIERRLDLDDAGAEPRNHRLDDVVTADAQALGHDLRRQMAIAEMPGDPHQMKRIGAADFHQRLGRGDHLDQAAVFQHQRIAAAQRDGVFEVEQEFEPARPCHRHPPPVPVVEIEHDGIGCGLRPAMLAYDLGRADHFSSNFTFDAFSSREPASISLENATLELLDLGVADDLDHRRRGLHL